MSEDNVARVMGTIYLSLLAGLDHDAATAANDYLRTISRSPYMDPDEKRFLTFLADNAIKQDDWPRFHVIPGGLSA